MLVASVANTQVLEGQATQIALRDPPPCYIALGRLRVGRPVMWRSGRLRVAKAVKGSWVSRMMRIVALDRGLLTPPPVLYRFGDGSGLLARCHGVQVGKLGGG